MGCIRHVDVPGLQSMVTMGGCASFSRSLGVSQILVLAMAIYALKVQPALPPLHSTDSLRRNEDRVVLSFYFRGCVEDADLNEKQVKAFLGNRELQCSI
jgi:hypothetical protein